MNAVLLRDGGCRGGAALAPPRRGNVCTLRFRGGGCRGGAALAPPDIDMNLNLAGKTVIVTGAGSNIGRAIALAFSRERANVVVAEIDEGQGAKTASEATG